MRARRLELDFTQQALAGRAGMSLASYRRFERTGEVSLHGLVMLGIALNAEEDFAALFAQRAYRSLDEITASPQRKRGRRRD
ncbi:MAG: hypothetical protein LBK28_07610 [Propionibacteriaceae bacterium]|nr:hypothetical protein [Propionibacteriaceae bacterium]